MNKQRKLRLGITHGDINGIGYEVITKALSDSRILEMCTPIIYGSPKVAAYHRKVLDLTNISFNQIRQSKDADSRKINIINCCDENIRVELGKATQIAGEAAYMALEKAVNDLKDRKIDTLVTAPINKDSIQSDLFNFPGHTEFLARETNAKNYLMLMVSETLKVGVVTGHIPIGDVAASLSKEKIINKLRVINHTMKQDFGLSKPRIAVLGLNPHAGDNGLLGQEEKEIIAPALEKANNDGIIALGPFAADGFFGSGQHTKFDVVLAMYHDQGLIPFKTVNFDKGINYTAGLPIIRTSPAHGTAFNLAGKDEAMCDSFREAIYNAIDIFNCRSTYRENSKNPLQSYEILANGESEDIDLSAIEEEQQDQY